MVVDAKGIAAALSKYVFSHSDSIRIYAEPFAHNTGSCRVLEKAGFQLEGIAVFQPEGIAVFQPEGIAVFQLEGIAGGGLYG